MNHAWRHHHSPSADNAGTVQSNNKWGSCHQYPKYRGPALNNNNSYNNHHQQNHGSVTTQFMAGWDRLGSSSQNWPSSGPEAGEDPDGYPYEQDAGPITTSSRRSLQVQNDHPLKWRVEAALHQTFTAPPVEPLNCKPIPLHNTQTPHLKERSPVNEEVKKSDQGFMLFLNILNKGVDINQLMEMVNKDSAFRLHSAQSQSKNAAQIHSATRLFESPPVEKGSLEEKQQHFKSPPLERIKLEEKEKRFKFPSLEKKKLEEKDQHIHLQSVLESLGLRLGKNEISQLSDRTQERLYGKKQTDQQQKEEQSSPAHYMSNRSKSPHPEDRHQPQYPLQMQPDSYPPAPYLNPHFPPQIYPHASQYATHSNYCTYNQPPAPGHMGYFYPNDPQNIPIISSCQKTDAHNTGCVNEQPSEMKTDSSESFPEEVQKHSLSKKSNIHCLVPAKHRVQKMSRAEKSKMIRITKMLRKEEDRIGKKKRRKQKKKRRSKKPKERQGTSITQQVFIEQNKQVEELLDDLPEPVTRVQGLKNPAKLMYRAELVKINDVEVPSGKLGKDVTLNAAVESTNEEKEEKTCKLTEEEIKANLKKKLEAFNTRMKKKLA